jgi:uncharacterized membrane protein
MCWPANVVGAFFIAVIIFDMVQKKYGDLPYHALSGVVVTFLFWLVCSFVSVTVSGAILIIPTVFISVFLFTVWFMNESLKQKGCCMNCNGNCQNKGHGNAYFVKRDHSLNTGSAPAPAPACKSTLTATTTSSTV